MTLDEYYAEVRNIKALTGTSDIHARLMALTHFNVIAELCPEPEYWHYEIRKPEEFPNDMKHDYPNARGGYYYRPNSLTRSHIIYY